ncbi:cytoglobin-1-like [Brachionichthys hirsutus]|uniref:cytoglobin-1-like n=1 Tax=Brachionichthys hirsutus TaxID=412623 RepID=UPI0036043A77
MAMPKQQGGLVLQEQPCPLTDKDILMIQESWMEVYKNHAANGQVILLRFFEEFPNAKKFFSNFKDMKQSDLERSKSLIAHGIRVMNFLNDVITNFDDTEHVATKLRDLGKSHAVQHNVEHIYFENLSNVILAVLKEAFSEVVTSEVADAWTKLFNNLCIAVKRVYEDLGWIKLLESPSK